MAENRHWGGVTARESRTFGSQGGPVRGEEGWRGQGRARVEGTEEEGLWTLKSGTARPDDSQGQGEAGEVPRPAKAAGVAAVGCFISRRPWASFLT